MPLILSMSPLRDLTQELRRTLHAEFVVVHDAERIADCVHVQAGKISPRAADAVENPALAARQQLGAGQLLRGDPGSLDRRAFRHVLQAKPAERQRDALADLLAFHIDEFQAAAAQIACNAVGGMEARDHAERGIVGFFAAAQHADLRSEDLLRAMDEIEAVFGLAGRCRGDDMKLLRAGLIRQGAKAAKFRQQPAAPLPDRACPS